SSRLRLPRSGKTALSLVLPTDQDRRLIWRFRSIGPTVGHAYGFAVVAEHNAKLGDSEFRRTLVGSSTLVDMWRAHSALDKDAGNDQAQGAAAPNPVTAEQCPADNPPPAPKQSPAPAAATTNSAPKPTPPRTIAQLTAFRPNAHPVVLGENKLTNGQVSSLVLEHLNPDDKKHVQVIRRDLSGYPLGIKFENNGKNVKPEHKIKFLLIAIETPLP